MICAGTGEYFLLDHLWSMAFFVATVTFFASAVDVFLCGRHLPMMETMGERGSTDSLDYGATSGWSMVGGPRARPRPPSLGGFRCLLEPFSMLPRA